MKQFVFLLKIRMSQWLILIFFLINKNTIAQYNLVPNGSFEQYTNCPSDSTLNAYLNSKPDYWYKPDRRGGGYSNSCTKSIGLGIPYNYVGGNISFQYAKTGNAYITLFYKNGSNYRNYFQAKLLDSLYKNKLYYAECYVSLTNPMKLGCNNQGMFFTKNVIYADTVNKEILIANPQITGYSNPIITDTLNWVKVSGIFSAQGGEQYLTLGNFKDDANTAFTIVQSTGYGGAAYYVDDVAVYSLDSFNLQADAGRDTTITIGDSVFIGSYINGIDTIQWHNQNTGQKIDSTRPGFWVKPLANTCYVLTQTVNGYTSSDTVCVTVKPLPLKFTNYNVISKKEKSVENIWATTNEINVSHYNIERSTNAKDFTVVGKVRANNKASNEYSFEDKSMVNSQWSIVYYRVAGVDNDGRKTYSPVKSVQLKVNSLSGVSVFPNPAKDVVNIVGDNIQQIVISTIEGKKVLSSTLKKVDVGNLPKGVYIISIYTTKGEIKNEKLLVE